MSDFTDDEDRQLVQLARMLSEPTRQGTVAVHTTHTATQRQTRPQFRRQINWETLLQMMVGTRKTKEALRQRLKTLKRKHNNDLSKFPEWYFKKRFENTANAAWHSDPPLMTPPRRSSRPQKSRKSEVRRSILPSDTAADVLQPTTVGDHLVPAASTHGIGENALRPHDQQSESSLWVLALAAETRTSDDAPPIHEKTSMRFILSYDVA